MLIYKINRNEEICNNKKNNIFKKYFNYGKKPENSLENNVLPMKWKRKVLNGGWKNLFFILLEKRIKYISNYLIIFYKKNYALHFSFCF